MHESNVVCIQPKWTIKSLVNLKKKFSAILNFRNMSSKSDIGSVSSDVILYYTKSVLLEKFSFCIHYQVSRYLEFFRYILIHQYISYDMVSDMKFDVFLCCFCHNKSIRHICIKSPGVLNNKVLHIKRIPTTWCIFNLRVL